MINHIRSVLLGGPCPGEFSEPEDTRLRPIHLSPSVSSVRNFLVPADFPARTRNFLATMWQALSSRHPMSRLTEAIDSRQLILSGKGRDLLTGSTAVTHRGATGPTFRGIMVPNVRSGIFSDSWVVRKTGATSVSIRQTSTSNSVNVDVTFQNGCSNQITFGGGITMRFLNSSSVPEIDTLVSSFAPFDFDLPQILSQMRTDSRCLSVFAIGDRVAGKGLLSDFVNSQRADVALAAATIACVVKATEEGEL